MPEKDLKEVVFMPDDVIRIDPDGFRKKEMSLNEYIEHFIQYPSVAFDAYQRLYAALRMFGTEEPSKPWKPKRWKFLDDRIESPWKRGGAVGPFEIYLYGIEEPVNEIMKYLEEASMNIDAKARFFILIGPPSSAKTDLINLMSYTLDGFGTLLEGELYTVKFNLEDCSDLFYGLKEVVCPAHDNPLNFVPKDKVRELLKKVNERVHPDYKWREIKFTYSRCPSCQYIIQKLKDHGISWEDKISVVNLLPQVDVAMEEFRPTAEKAYDPQRIFGGSVNMNRFAKILSKDHPLVIDFGIGGGIDRPSPQHHIVHFSEMYKAHELGLLDEILDLISSRNLKVLGKYDVKIDSVIFGTTNLEEYGKVSSLPRLGEYLKSRSYKIPMGYLLVIDDLAQALKKRIFEKMSVNRNIHVPPHYVERFLATLGVLSALDVPESEMKITLVQKALIYNDEVPYGLERELEEIREELRRAARTKPMEELTEGIKYGIPFRFYQDLVAKLMLALEKIPEKAKAEILDSNYRGCLSMVNIKNFYDEVIRTYDGINSETRRRLVDMRAPTERNEPVQVALDESYELYVQSVIRDVNRAILGEEKILNLAVKYLAQVYESELGRKEYKDPSGRVVPIDYKFLEDVEKAAGVVNRSEFRKHFAAHVKYRLHDFKTEKYPMRELARSLLNEDNLFRRAIENYAMENVLPSMIEDVSLAYSPANEAVMQELYKLGYCKTCASLALQLAALRRKDKK